MFETTPRKPLTTKQRVELFKEHKGLCCICKGRINVGEKWIDEHINPLGLTGTNEMSNRGPAHVACAKGKTKGDLSNIAKAKRVEAKHFGAKVKKHKWQSRSFGRERFDNTKQINQEGME
jgi:5-methylcytosine-specific restriction endonuclease McrA